MWAEAWPDLAECVWAFAPPQALIYMLTAGMLLLKTTHTQGAHVLTHLHRSHQFRHVVPSIGSILNPDSKRGIFPFFSYTNQLNNLDLLYLHTFLIMIFFKVV